VSLMDDVPIPFPEVGAPSTAAPAIEFPVTAAPAIEFPVTTAPVAETPEPPPASGTAIIEFVGDLQAILGLSFNGLMPTETPQGKAMVLCFGTGLGKMGGFDVGIILTQGAVIDMGDDVTDVASHEAAMRSILGMTVEHVDTIVDSVEGGEFEALRVLFSNGRQIKIGGPGGMVLTDHAPSQEQAQ